MSVGDRANLTARINNLDLGDHTSKYYFRDMLLQLIALGDIGFGGEKFYIDPVNGSDSNNGTGPADAKLTLAAGYALLTANANDMLFILGGASALTIPSGFVWAKSYCHLIGLAAGSRYTSMVRLNHSADFTPLFPITASGCQFSNFRIQHGRGNAANLVNMNISGDNNSFYNMHLEGPNHATEAGAAFRQLVLADGASGNTFVACTIGGREIQQTVATGREIEFAGNNEDTHFEDCIIRSYADNVGHEQVEAGVDLGGESALVEFERCKFLQLDPNITLTKLIEEPTTGSIMLSGCKAVRATDWSGDASIVIPVDSSIG